MGKLSYNQLRDFFEVAGAGISLGTLAIPDGVVVTFALTLLTLMPMANRWAERLFTDDLQSDV